MGIASEDILNIYSLEWAEKYGIAKKDIKWVLKMIGELYNETNLDEDSILATFLYVYHNGNPPKQETILDKFDKAKNNKNAGKLIKFFKY